MEARKYRICCQKLGICPKNADYFFPTDNVIAELKSLEGGEPPFGSTAAFLNTLDDAGVTGSQLMGFLWRGESLPVEALSLLRKRYRRMIEQRIKNARRQIIDTRSLVGDAGTRSLILIANDKLTFTSHAWLFGQICGVMTNYESDAAIDGIVYFSPNVFLVRGQRLENMAFGHPHIVMHRIGSSARS